MGLWGVKSGAGFCFFFRPPTADLRRPTSSMFSALSGFPLLSSSYDSAMCRSIINCRERFVSFWFFTGNREVLLNHGKKFLGSLLLLSVSSRISVKWRAAVLVVEQFVALLVSCYAICRRQFLCGFKSDSSLFSETIVSRSIANNCRAVLAYVSSKCLLFCYCSV